MAVENKERWVLCGISVCLFVVGEVVVNKCTLGREKPSRVREATVVGAAKKVEFVADGVVKKML